MAICLSAYLPVCPSSYLHVCLSACPPICLSAYLPICPCGYLPICLSAYLPICPSACLPICLSAYVAICLSASLPMWLSAYLPNCLPPTCWPGRLPAPWPRGGRARRDKKERLGAMPPWIFQQNGGKSTGRVGKLNSKSAVLFRIAQNRLRQVAFTTFRARRSRTISSKVNSGKMGIFMSAVSRGGNLL